MRGLFPRHLRATFASFFVHFPILGQTAPPQGGKGINSFKKIVQICALSCIKIYRKKAAFAAMKITCREKSVCAVE
ncbi:hypothetical protein D2H17_04570 [Salmonella enterica subsp. enterica serovar Muenchen]|nr:hypothetical protein [Salmonella enterica]EAA9699888.1 hypothetical protein [Salmonella enterica subsp. enterica serovar Oranienburg]EAM3709194.1 hypothetical protein [Salmonella enterica subsp. enterica serovar Muenchen]EBC9761560.1 hypothetical protein [Salmonella enterica subsp. enterica serovar Tennessee]EBZ3728478.1 hypothetical protein [Salmonella enterica subsp. enterica serovar Newport]ECT7171214.1 hypothetical protein [Salmonella enterica subsp. enterica serovar Hadar]ECU8369404.1